MPVHTSVILPATTKHFDRAKLPISSLSSLLHGGSITSHIIGEMIMTTSLSGSLRKKRDSENEVGKMSVAFNHQGNKGQG